MSASAWEGATSAASEGLRALRRSLGPTAWTVLADVCTDARADDAGIVVVATSARRVAGHVGIAKDTAARALRRLTAAGILRRRPQGAGPTGRFTPGVYEVRLPLPVTPCLSCRPAEDTVGSASPQCADTGRVAMPVSAQTTLRAVPVQRPTRARIASNSGQLSLLDPGAGSVERSQ